MSDRRVLVNLRGLLTPDPARAWVVDRTPDAALALENGRVAWLGRAADLPAAWADAPRVDGGGAWATPGFVDPHTHLLFGGNRSGEFNRRLHGDSYQQIAAEGGGIRETVRATRGATVDELVASGEERLKAFRRRGVVHLECKTGYGLELEAESRLAAAYAELKKRGWSLDVTLLPAHDLAPEFAGDAEANARAVAEYVPRELHCRVAQFISRDQPHSFDVLEDPRLAWKDHVRHEFVVHTIPGGDMDLFYEPHVETLAARLRAELDHATSGNL